MNAGASRPVPTPGCRSPEGGRPSGPAAHHLAPELHSRRRPSRRCPGAVVSASPRDAAATYDASGSSARSPCSPAKACGTRLSEQALRGGVRQGWIPRREAAGCVARIDVAEDDLLGEGARLEPDLPASRCMASRAATATSSLKIRWPEPPPRSICCNCELDPSACRSAWEWRHGRSISTLRQWPEVFQPIFSPSRARQHGGDWPGPAEDAGRHGANLAQHQAEMAEGALRRAFSALQPSVPFFGVQPSGGGHRARLHRSRPRWWKVRQNIRTSCPNSRRAAAADVANILQVADVRGAGRVQRPRWSPRRSLRSSRRRLWHPSPLRRPFTRLEPRPPRRRWSDADLVASRGRVAALAASAWFGGGASAADPLLGRFPADPTQVAVAGIRLRRIHWPISFTSRIRPGSRSAGIPSPARTVRLRRRQRVTGDGVLALASLAVGPCMSVPTLAEAPYLVLRSRSVGRLLRPKVLESIPAGQRRA